MNRRTVLSSVTVGLLGFLAGCIGSSNSPDDDSSPTGSNSGSSSATSTVASDSIETADRTASPANTRTATARSPVPQTAPAGPTNVEMTTRTGVLTITEINANPPGNDRQKLFQETIVFKNTGEQQYDISGYTVKYGGTGRTYTFPNSMKTVLPAGQTFRLNTGTSGQTIMPAQYETFAGFDEPVLSNDGGTITVTDANGDIVLEAMYLTE